MLTQQKKSLVGLRNMSNFEKNWTTALSWKWLILWLEMTYLYFESISQQKNYFAQNCNQLRAKKLLTEVKNIEAISTFPIPQGCNENNGKKNCKIWPEILPNSRKPRKISGENSPKISKTINQKKLLEKAALVQKILVAGRKFLHLSIVCSWIWRIQGLSVWIFKNTRPFSSTMHFCSTLKSLFSRHFTSAFKIHSKYLEKTFSNSRQFTKRVSQYNSNLLNSERAALITGSQHESGY